MIISFILSSKIQDRDRLPEYFGLFIDVKKMYIRSYF